MLWESYRNLRLANGAVRSTSNLTEYCIVSILHAPIVRLAAFLWPKGFPFYHISLPFLRALSTLSPGYRQSDSAVGLAHCSDTWRTVRRSSMRRIVRSLPPARPFRGAPPPSNRGGPLQRSVARITGQEENLTEWVQWTRGRSPSAQLCSQCPATNTSYTHLLAGMRQTYYLFWVTGLTWSRWWRPSNVFQK